MNSLKESEVPVLILSEAARIAGPYYSPLRKWEGDKALGLRLVFEGWGDQDFLEEEALR